MLYSPSLSICTYTTNTSSVAVEVLGCHEMMKKNVTLRHLLQGCQTCTHLHH